MSTVGNLPKVLYSSSGDINWIKTFSTECYLRQNIIVIPTKFISLTAAHNLR